MIFHPRTDWERPPRFTWRTLLGSSSSRRCYKKLDLKQSPPTLLARFVGYLDGFLGSSAKEKAKAGHESGTVVSVNANNPSGPTLPSQDCWCKRLFYNSNVLSGEGVVEWALAGALYAFTFLALVSSTLLAET